MRGKGGLHLFAADRQGITPAYAGKSDQEILGTRNAEDHPRLCGEKSSGIVTSVPPLGSPPPMRGKVFKSCCIILCSRITPAYAGKSRKWTEIQLHTWDHPRLCGEKSVLVMRAESPLGSPPPMRGKGFSAFEFYVDFGITPAYAGKRQRTGRHRLHRRDHPRLCGEKQLHDSSGK